MRRKVLTGTLHGLQAETVANSQIANFGVKLQEHRANGIFIESCKEPCSRVVTAARHEITLPYSALALGVSASAWR
ncbi:MAG: hypothetical protein JWO89_2604 [Verrucomicrobiaceae bacterium]|nr:hypothetical protein [Verrucomicrobiaceae bacterium]